MNSSPPSFTRQADKRDRSAGVQRRGGLSTRQEPYINGTIANHVLALLARLFRHGRIPYHGGFVNLATGHVTPLSVDPSTWARLRKQAERDRRRFAPKPACGGGAQAVKRSSNAGQFERRTMFTELLPILRNRTVMLTLALVNDQTIRVNVIPKRLKEGDSGDCALTTPLTVTGTPEELDREFPGQLVAFTGSFVKLGSNLSEIEAAHATAVKAVEAERKKDLENKRKGSGSKPASTPPAATPVPEIKDGKPVFGSKTIAANEAPSLFDSHETTEASADRPTPQ